MGPRRGRTIMLQGTSSHVGKSVVATALCRILKQDGFRVAPFKSQNMSNNSCVTSEGGEIGRAQYVQAEACGIEPSVIMNPILIKPKADRAAQVVFMGRPAGDFEAGQYRREFTKRALPVIKDCLDRLRGQYDAVVIEGAGSPAEVNLKDGDIVNMRVAKLAQAPVLLVADIDRGGVFAAIIGTLELLEPDERELVAGIVINKFRGSRALLEPGIDFIEKRTGLPVLGVLPYISGHDIPDEDSVALEAGPPALPACGGPWLRIAVVRLPRISNFTDFDALRVPGVSVCYVSSPRELDRADCIMLPGTKNTIADLLWLRETGMAQRILEAAGKVPVVGICGGFQLLGRVLDDPDGTEASPGSYEGLGLLDVSTTFGSDKTTTWSTGTICGETPYFPPSGEPVRGYEIHTGVTTLGPGARPLIKVISRDGVDTTGVTGSFDGAVSEDGKVIGTYFHGLFDNSSVRTAFLAQLFRERGLPVPNQTTLQSGRDWALDRERAYERLASIVRAHLDVEQLYRIMGLTK